LSPNNGITKCDDIGMTQPTYAELVDLVVEMRTELNFLRAENAALKVRVADLEAQLRTNSQNSSKPPSSDGPATPTRSLRKLSKRKPGGQDGHRGQTLKQVADPDVVSRHEPSCCHGCGSHLSGAAEVNCSRRQVSDIPPIKIHVTEHQIISRRCHCGKTSTGDVPTQARAPVQYGPVMCAVIIYLFMGQFLFKSAPPRPSANSSAFPSPMHRRGRDQSRRRRSHRIPRAGHHRLEGLRRGALR